MPYTIGTSVACKVFSRGRPRTWTRGKKEARRGTRIALPRINKPCSATIRASFGRPFELSNSESFTNVVEVRLLWPREKLCVFYDANHEKKQYFFALLCSQLSIDIVSRVNFIITFRSVKFFSLTFFFFFLTWCLWLAIDCKEKWMYRTFSLLF